MKLSNHLEQRILKATYTTYENRTVNEAIGRQILEFTKTILAQVKDIQSLFLLGGYGRGEGSVLHKKEVIPLGDYDFLLVSNLPHAGISIAGIENLQRKFSVQYHVGVNHIWRFLLPFLDRRIYWYEAKFGSALLFGDEKGLDRIPIQGSKDIDLREGISLMSNRLMGSLRVFDPRFCRHPANQEQNNHLVFQSVKAILASGDALLLLSGNYHFSYEERCRRFMKSYKNDFPEFVIGNPALKADYEKATLFKLKPDFEMYPDPVKLWFKANRHLLQTLFFYTAKVGLEISLTSRSTQDELTALSSYLLQSSGPYLLDYLIFNRNMIRHLKSGKAILKVKQSFSAITRAALCDLALSIDEDGEINQAILDKALIRIGGVISLPKPVFKEQDPFEKWKCVRNSTLLAWKLSRN